MATEPTPDGESRRKEAVLQLLAVDLPSVAMCWCCWRVLLLLDDQVSQRGLAGVSVVVERR